MHVPRRLTDDPSIWEGVKPEKPDKKGKAKKVCCVVMRGDHGVLTDILRSQGPRERERERQKKQNTQKKRFSRPCV